MLWGKKFVREKFTESVARYKSRSNSDIRRERKRMSTRESVFVYSFLAIIAFIVTLICFWGQDLIWVQFMPNSKARMQMIAEIPFEYSSKIKTQRLREQRRNLVAPIYKIDLERYFNFEREIHKLDELLDTFSSQQQTTKASLFELRSFVRKFNEKHGMNIAWGDVDILMRSLDEYARTGILVEGLSIVRDILEDGVVDQNLNTPTDDEYFLNLEIEGAVRRAHNRTESEAVRFFKLRFSSVETTAEVLQAVGRILQTGIRPNIVFDNAATALKATRVLQNTPDVIVGVAYGDAIVEAGAVVTEEDYEQLLAYRGALKEAGVSLIHSNDNLVERFFVSFSVLLLIFFFFHTTRDDLKVLRRKEIFLVVTLLILNLLACRLILWIFELRILEGVVSLCTSTAENTAAVETTKVLKNPICLLPYMMPTTLACLLGTLLLRTYVGVVLGVTMSIFSCLMLSQPAEFLVALFLVVFVSVYLVRHSYIRAQVIRSGNIGGAVFALLSLMVSIGMQFPKEILFLQAFFSFLSCLLSSMFALMVLPVFENIFKCCTNIFLIELTDYSVPLLSKMQILAPGTYNHSLMVANLSEQAAISIRANPFLCRTLALYHDIGKLAKPEYFTENQSNNRNPHDEKTPFMSALIIKSHVKEGVAIAKAAGLPPRVIDGILEHHGTTVIRYFYSKALKQQEGQAVPGGAAVQSGIEQAAFKYDGPRPRSKETLILSVADSIEAASRSLYNPTPQSIQTLTNSIIDGKIKENQFDECLITFREVDELRKSFYFTLLNMMHSRVNYDDVKA